MLKKLLLLLSCISSTNLLAQNLYVNGNSTIIDKETGTHYATVQANEGDTLLHFTLDFGEPSVTHFQLDGINYHPHNDSISVVANRLAHQLVIERDDRNDTLSLVLTNLPLISIERETTKEFSLDEELPTTFTLYDPYQRTNNQRVFTTKAYTSLRGATAANLDKKSFKLKFVDNQFNEENDVTLLGIRNTDTYILDGAAIDYSRMRNRVCFDLWNEFSTLRDNDMMRNGTKGYFVEMILDGKYHGIYCLSDKINRSLLGLKKTQGEGTDAIVRGVLYKCKAGDLPTVYLGKPTEPWLSTQKDRWFSWYLKYPDEICDKRSWNALYELLEHTNELGASADSVNYTMSNLYEDNVVEYAVFAMSMKLLDNMMHNTYLSVKNCTKSLKCWITPWDMDGSLGRSGTANRFVNPANSTDVFQDCHPFRYYYDNQVEPFYSKFCEKWQELHEGVLSSEHVNELIDKYEQQLEGAGAWKRERNRWYGMYNFWLDRPIELAETLAEETAYMKWWYKSNEENLEELLGQTHISEYSILRQKVSITIYNLTGRSMGNKKLDELPHGIYIVNGKKVVK